MARAVASRAPVRLEAVSRARSFAKRGIDVAGSFAGLIVALPLFLAVALAIRLESDGPALFRQVRVGRNREPFAILKFRTMLDGADEMKDDLRSANETDGSLFKIEDDPRLTRVGRFLRRTSLDELPQLINILKGEMSLVGPRPLPVVDYDFEVAGMITRLAVRPGLTGLWQVNGRSLLGTQDLIEFDHAYLRRYTLTHDFRILLRTLPAVLSGRGAQ